MGKYILYAVIALVIAFGLNFFGVIHVSWLDPPFSMEQKAEGGKKYMTLLRKPQGINKKFRSVMRVRHRCRVALAQEF